MAVDDSDVIDLVGTDRETGNIVLTVADHLPWEECTGRLAALQDKLNAYMAFVESGQLYEDYPNAKPGVLVRIEIAFKYEPSSEGREFLTAAKEAIGEHGVKLFWSCPDLESEGSEE